MAAKPLQLVIWVLITGFAAFLFLLGTSVASAWGGNPGLMAVVLGGLFIVSLLVTFKVARQH